MQPTFWLERWEQGQIGWHQCAAHRALQAFWSALEIPCAGRVLVPLCGKSLDMVWLRERGHAVVGVDLSPLAARDFFRERGLVPQIESRGGLQRWTGGGYEFWVGDLFAVTARELGCIDALYDRGALIALPPESRPQYCAKISGLVRAGCRGLLITLEYDQTLVPGPPFCVSEPEVMVDLAPVASLRVLERMRIPADNPRFKEAGVESFTEVSYALEYSGG